jgi:hypothetical protein
VLERAGLSRAGGKRKWRPAGSIRVRSRTRAGWLEHYRRFWDESFDAWTITCGTAGGGEKMASSAAAQAIALELVITRTFDAPRALVFACWTEREHQVR